MRSEDEINKLKAENARLKEERSKLLSKNIEKQCKINNLQQKLSIKEISLKVNGKKYNGLSGIDKAKLFFNNEKEIRGKKILELEDYIENFQWTIFKYCIKITQYKQALQEIKAIADEWINNDWSCFHCRTNMDEKLKDILALINKAEEE